MLPEVVDGGHVSALDIFVESIAFAQRAPRADGRARGAQRACTCAATSSSSRRSRSVPGGARGGRPLGRPPLAAAPRRRRPARGRRAAPRCCSPAPSSSDAEQRAPARALLDAGAIVVLATDANPGTSPVLSAAARDRPRRAPLRAEHARGARGDDAQRRVDARAGSATAARSRSASAPTSCCSTCPAEHIAYRFGRNPVAADLHRRAARLRAPRRGVEDPRGVSRRRAVAGRPAMANAHSHAFQIGLRGAAERPAPAAGGADDFWSWRTEMYRLAGGARPRLDARRRRARLRARWRRRLRLGRRVPLRPPPARRAPVRRAERDGDRAGRGRARAGPRDRAAPGRLPPRRLGRRRSAAVGRPAALLRPRRRDLPRARRRAAGVGARPCAASSVGVAVHSVRAVPASWVRAIGEYAARHDLVRHVHACEQRRELRRVRGRARLHADRAARALRLPRPAHQRRPRDPRHRARHRAARAQRRDGDQLPDHRGQPRRRLPAGAALPRGRACRSRSAPTRRSASTPSRRRASSRPARAARARRASACSPRAATCGARSPAPAARASAWTARRRRSRSTRGHPDLAGVAARDLPFALATCASAGVVTRTAAGRAVERR